MDARVIERPDVSDNVLADSGDRSVVVMVPRGE
jgi:hypothetical protein